MCGPAWADARRSRAARGTPHPWTRGHSCRQVDRRSPGTGPPPSRRAWRPRGSPLPTLPGSLIRCRYTATVGDWGGLGNESALNTEITRAGCTEFADVGHHRVGQQVHRPATCESRHQLVRGRSIAGHERLHRQDRGGECLGHQVLTLGQKQPRGDTVLFEMQPPRVLHAWVGARCDRCRDHRWARGYGVAKADLAASAITPKALGSVTARSASTLRSSVMSASLRPCMNWL